MKRFFSLLLASLLTFPMSGCASTSASAMRPSETQPADSDDADSPEQELSRKMTELYQVSLSTAEQELAALSGELSAVPVQSRPATEEAAAACSTYLERLDAVSQSLRGYREQIDEDYEEKNLLDTDYNALIFQCDQLSSRIDSLYGTLNVIYGTVYKESA